MSKLYDLLSAMCGKIKKPDWNQNDPTAPDFVKNRPFWTGDPVGTAMIPNRTENFAEGAPFMGEFDTSGFVAGANVVVEWDGVSYNCEVSYNDIAKQPVAGNGAASGLPDTGNDEPFFIAALNGQVLVFATSSGHHTFSVSTVVCEVKGIDPMYIPTVRHANQEEIGFVDYCINLTRLFAVQANDVVDIGQWDVKIPVKKWNAFLDCVNRNRTGTEISASITWGPYVIEQVYFSDENMVSIYGYYLNGSPSNNSVGFQHMQIKVSYDTESETATLVRDYCLRGSVSAEEV